MGRHLDGIRMEGGRVAAGVRAQGMGEAIRRGRIGMVKIVLMVGRGHAVHGRVSRVISSMQGAELTDLMVIKVMLATMAQADNMAIKSTRIKHNKIIINQLKITVNKQTNTPRPLNNKPKIKTLIIIKVH